MKLNKKIVLGLSYIGVTAFLIWLIIVVVGLYSTDENNSTLRALPRPIADEAVLITSVGQSTDAYIVKDIANKYQIDNYFRPQASSVELDDIKAVAVVIGFSKVGIRLNELKWEDELERTKQLMDQVRDKELVLIVIYLRGSQSLNQDIKEVFSVVAPETDYFIVVGEGSHNRYYDDLADGNGIPITFLDDVTEVSEPFVSVFR